MKNIAINGFGRIGRNFLRALLEDPSAKNAIRVAVINIGPGVIESTAHIFKYDTVMGTYKGNVSMEADVLIIDDDVRIKIVGIADPAALNWKPYHLDWVVDCSGRFTKRAEAQKHLSAGAARVLISAPSKDDDITIIPGVNRAQYDANKHFIVSLGSCTTNAFAPLLHVLHNAFTITQGHMTTVHSYTNSQVLLDGERPDVRRARSATLNIIPTTTGAAHTVTKVIPALQGLISAHALRIPLANVSLIDFSFNTQKPLSPIAVNKALEEAGKKEGFANIIQVSYEPLVSSDYAGNSHSVTVDGMLTSVQGTLGKVYGWYDNEWAYSVRLKDFLMSV